MSAINRFLLDHNLRIATNPCVSPDFCLDWPALLAKLKAGGAGDITASGRLWTGQKGSNVSSPILHDGHLYWMNDQQGIAYCAKASTGEIVYEERIAGAGQVYASPVLAGGHIYYLSRTGKTFVVPAEPRFRLVATNNLQDGGGFNGSPAVADGRLFIRSDKHMYCIGTNK